MSEVRFSQLENLPELLEELQRRKSIDGIPRYITYDGKIMKCDWELSTDVLDDLDGEALEEHIAKLMEAQREH